MERIYFIGIAGSLMGNVACLLKQMGYSVGGADRSAYPPISDLLARSGIQVDEGFPVGAMERFGPTVVVVGNATSRGNPQVERAWGDQQWTVLSLPEAIDRLVFPGRQRVVVAGTHGKTTTASITAWLLREEGLNPGYLIGGVVPDLGGGAGLGAIGEGSPVVLEGDEYDSAFFDKRSKFVHYRPTTLILNNLEFDHADIFRDIEDVRRTFRHLLATVRPGGVVFYNADDPELVGLFPIDWCRSVGVGFGERADWVIRDTGDEVCLEGRDGAKLRVRTETRGEHWIRNAAMAALVAGELKGIGGGEAFDLRGFGGVKRRMEVLGDHGSVLVMEDFGHHPTAIRVTIAAIRKTYPRYRIWAAFEPRSNTARRKIFEEAFASALAGADAVWIGPVHRAGQLGADERFEPEAVCEMIRAKGVPAETGDTNRELGQLIQEKIGVATLESPILTVFFTNGSFDGIQHCLGAKKPSP